MRGLTVLAGAALLVVLGVLALAGAILPDAVATQPVEAAPDDPDRNGPSDDASTSVPESPPDAIGGLIDVSGDRPGSFDLDAVASSFFGTETRVELASDESSLLVSDDDGTPFIDQVVYEGLNFFLDPGDCDLTEQQPNEELGLIRLMVSCVDVVDVQGNSMVTMVGHIEVPLTTGVAGDEYHSGGTLTLSGDIVGDVTFAEAVWTVYPEDLECNGCEAGMFASSFNPSTEPATGEPLVSVAFSGVGEERLSGVSLVTYHPDPRGDEFYEFWTGPDDCALDQTSVAQVAPSTELLRVTIECPELTDQDGDTTISMSGTLMVHKVSDDPRIPTP